MTAMVLLSAWMESQVEFWRKTKYEGYDVSSFGRVRSFWISERKREGRGFVRKMISASRILEASPAINGHYACVEIAGKTRTVHRLVAESFLPVSQRLPWINHKTGQKSNNWLANIEWKTPSENLTHALEYGLREPPHGEEHHFAKLLESDVKEIRRRVAAGESPLAVVNDFPVTLRQVERIINRTSWKRLQ